MALQVLSWENYQFFQLCFLRIFDKNGVCTGLVPGTAGVPSSCLPGFLPLCSLPLADPPLLLYLPEPRTGGRKGQSGWVWPTCWVEYQGPGHLCLYLCEYPCDQENAIKSQWTLMTSRERCRRKEESFFCCLEWGVAALSLCSGPEIYLACLSLIAWGHYSKDAS